MRKVMLTLSAVLVLVAFTFAGCSSGGEKKTTGTKKAPATTTTPAPAPTK